MFGLLSVSDEHTNSVSLKSKTNVSFIGTGSVEWIQDSLVFTLISITLVVYICASLLELKLLNHVIYLKLRKTLLFLQAEQMNFFHSKWPEMKKVVLLNENSVNL